eukprot:gene3264-6455_t
MIPTIKIPFSTGNMEVDGSCRVGGSSPTSHYIDSANASSESKPTFYSGMKEILLKGQLNLLLIFIPFALITWVAGAPHSVIFVFSLLSIAPLAERLGFVTEQIALHTTETIGGLLNVTFGNATELIVSIAALVKGYYRLVQLSLLGSILSNMLLVLGTALLFGGLKFKIQKFDRVTGQMNSSMLALACMALLFPTTLNFSGEADLTPSTDDTEAMPIATSDDENPLHGEENNSGIALSEEETRSRQISDVSFDPGNNGNGVSAAGGATTATTGDNEEEEDHLGFQGALFWLAVITVLIAVLSEALVETIQEGTDDLHISTIFTSVIILPIIGNAAEHASAIIFAAHNKLDLALSIAIGSSTQIAIFVIPLLVIISWITNKSLDLNFKPFESCTLLLSVITVTFAIQRGTSNWLVGLILVCGYVIVCVGFWVHEDEKF